MEQTTILREGLVGGVSPSWPKKRTGGEDKSLRVSVIVVTYNAWEALAACLRSLTEQERPPDEVVVVDNASRDGTPELLGRHFPWVTRIDLGRNVGFAAGNNRGLQAASGDAVVLLNNDTVAEPFAVARLVEPLEVDPTVGAVAATMVFASAPDIVASAGIDVYRNGLALDRLLGARRAELNGSQDVFGPSGGAAAYRRSALDACGFFPADYFMYLEDVDLAWRLRLHGWRAVHAPDAVVTHAYSASAGEGSPLKRWLLARNRVWLLARCFPTTLARRHFASIIRYDASAAAYAFARGDSAWLRGRMAGLRRLGTRLAERRAIQGAGSSSGSAPADLAAWLRPPPSYAQLLRWRQLTASLAGPDVCEGTYVRETEAAPGPL